MPARKNWHIVDSDGSRRSVTEHGAKPDTEPIHNIEQPRAPLAQPQQITGPITPFSLTITVAGATFSLTSGAAPSCSGSMPVAAAVPVFTAPLSPTTDSSVAGRIDAAPSALLEAVETWLTELETNGASPNTIRAWRPMVEKDIAGAGWTDPSQLDYKNVVSYLTEQMKQRGWSAATYRTHLAALKSLDRHLKRVKNGDLQAVQGVRDNEGGMGARASTIEEAREFLAASWDCECRDRRCRSPRTLYYLCLFSGGFRESEPGLWEWRHLLLDGPVPHIHIEPWMHKAKRRVLIALTPELAEKLKEWRAKCGAVKPIDKVFTYKVPRHVWQRDRERAGIPYKDERGRCYTQHAARKGWKTQLVRMNLQAEWVDHFMRHTSHVGSRYFDPSLAEQADKIKDFPRLWPEGPQASAPKPFSPSSPDTPEPHNSEPKSRSGEKSSESVFASVRASRYAGDSEVTNGHPSHQDISTRHPPLPAHGIDLRDRTAAGAESSCRVAGSGAEPPPRQDGFTSLSAQTPTFDPNLLNQKVAALLRAAAEVMEAMHQSPGRDLGNGQYRRSEPTNQSAG